jgi:hypothetical protein
MEGHIGTTKGETGVGKEVSQVPLQAAPNLFQTQPVTHHTKQLQVERNMVRKLSHIPSFPLTHVHSHTQHLLSSINHILK